VNKLIICPKKRGNTYKVCRYVSENTDFAIKILGKDDDMDLSGHDIVILSSGIYGGHIHRKMLEYAGNIKNGSSTKFYLLLTWLGGRESDRSAFNEMAAALEKNGIILDKNYMKCLGKNFLFIKRSHPDKKYFENVLEWVKKL
jgi:flavodoxin